MFLSKFFQNSPFQKKSDFVRIFSHNNYSTNFFQYLLSSFLERKQVQKILLFFNSRLKIFWSRVQPGWKISGRPWESILRIKSRSTMIVKNWSNKKFSRFCRGQNFVLFTSQTWRDNSNIFKQVFFRTMSAYRWRDLTTEKRKKNIKLLFKNLF